ncbi:phage head closure protein [Paenibacillus lactis]|uniref:phage head closure protein n=1 Tax=Paenibacillus lactis TaxID=228574 RepID=UPI00203E7B8B|nr:phage head closure protein [Paenibacillus lactis]MCM3492848.1 phage head closure protein [Paenibacillus lactis]
MLWRDVIDLIPVVVTKNGYGEEVETDGIPRTVYANKKSVRQSEFYQALAAGMKPEIVFEVMVADYTEEPKVKYGDKYYRVIRTYSANGERIELVCSIYPMEE